MINNRPDYNKDEMNAVISEMNQSEDEVKVKSEFLDKHLS